MKWFTWRTRPSGTPTDSSIPADTSSFLKDSSLSHHWTNFQNTDELDPTNRSKNSLVISWCGKIMIFKPYVIDCGVNNYAMIGHYNSVLPHQFCDAYVCSRGIVGDAIIVQRLRIVVPMILSLLACSSVQCRNEEFLTVLASDNYISILWPVHVFTCRALNGTLEVQVADRHSIAPCYIVTSCSRMAMCHKTAQQEGANSWPGIGLLVRKEPLPASLSWHAGRNQVLHSLCNSIQNND